MIRIVALGGTVNDKSMTEKALRYAARQAEKAGAVVDVFGGEYLTTLPHYGGPGHQDGAGTEMIEAVRKADGILIAAPGYHGTVSGVVKNALDFLEDLSGDTRPYLHARAVGLIATAAGEQASMGTLTTLRAIIHALRGWPTPMGATIKAMPDLFDDAGNCTDPRTSAQLEMVGEQVVMGARSLKLGSEA
ncbi:NADPH:quinone oxidoreductase [Altererythrobacter epoxidivorans]|uniref:NADPH:quinone oxidoreductase n=1 Tax=Altererythrobacter epoxidivorans TaxID=361183 RepID=A0A0M3T9R2_9SPHN|nr:NAD(P)H-dependent oxidoreductase [Altererythrobacter epoxidivorans]ALE15476.1 NADPH:quinone oxidoreductase [Altererythrobacter epoxidivorans]